MENHNVPLQYTVFSSKNELPAKYLELFTAAEVATEKSYAPYSGFNVGAALLLENGHIITAGNQENASYPVCICAEGSVLSAAASQHPNIAIKAIAVTAYLKGQIVKDVAAPCGVCRQAIKEWQGRQTSPIPVLFSGKDNSIYIIENIDVLLPFGFEGGHLK